MCKVSIPVANLRRPGPELHDHLSKLEKADGGLLLRHVVSLPKIKNIWTRNFAHMHDLQVSEEQQPVLDLTNHGCRKEQALVKGKERT